MRHATLFLLFQLIALSTYSQTTTKIEWLTRIGETGTDYTGAIATDSLGNIYVAGGFAGQLIFNTDTLTSASPFKSSGFIAKYDAMGNAIWGKLLPVTSQPEFIIIKNLRVSRNGRIYTVGSLDYNGYTRAYISINRSNGSQVTYYDNMFGAEHADVDVDSVDNSFLIGNFNSSGSTSYIFKLDSIGTPKWSYYSNQENTASNVKYRNGTVLVAGQFRYQYTLADTQGTATIQLNASAGVNDYDFFMAHYSKDGKLLAGYSEPGLVTTVGGPFEYSSDFTKSGTWNVTWGNPTPTAFLKQYSPTLSVVSNQALPINIPCPFTPTAYTRGSKYSDESVYSYSGLACPAVRNYIYSVTGNITDTIRNPIGTGTLPSQPPARALSFTKEGDLVILSDFIGTVNYSDSLGVHSTSSVVGSQDVFVAKLHRCDSYAPQISNNGDTLFCALSGMTYQWLLDNSPIPGATGQQHIPSANGNYSVEVTDSWGCTNISASTTVTVGILTIENVHLNIYPNPVQQNLSVEGSKKECLLQVFDIMGKVVTSKISDGNRAELDMSHVQPGVYILRVGNHAIRIQKE